jgi:hypothetical protein
MLFCLLQDLLLLTSLVDKNILIGFKMHHNMIKTKILDYIHRSNFVLFRQNWNDGYSPESWNDGYSPESWNDGYSPES